MKKYIYVNLKRFDVPIEDGGVNFLAPIEEWAEFILKNTKEHLSQYKEELQTAFFWPESHVFNAVAQRRAGHSSLVGCQGVASFDIGMNGNFGAMTTLRSALAMARSGCETVIIGHSEERSNFHKNCKAITGLSIGNKPNDILNKYFSQMIGCAQQAGLDVLYCIGENEDQKHDLKNELKRQLTSIETANQRKLVIAYEPIWAIGPGKPVPTTEEIRTVAKIVKDIHPNVPLIYGGGLKEENAHIIGSISEVDGGLIALTDFTGKVGFKPESFLKIIDLYFTGYRTREANSENKF